MSRAFSSVAESTLYGFRIMYAAKVEGIPYLFVEKGGTGASAPTGYTELEALIVDDSAAIGSNIDRTKGLGVGYDLSMTIQHNATVTELFKPPALITALGADLTYNATTLTVKDTTGWTTSTSIYAGREYFGTASTVTSTQFQGVTRGGPNSEWKGYAVDQTSAVSTWVTNVPLHWRGRQVKLYAVPVDAYGKTHGADLLTEAALVWRGKIRSDPEPTRHGWSFKCRSLERELEDPFSGAITAQGRLDPDGDWISEVSNPLAVWRFEHAERSAAVWTYVSGSRLEFQPFSGYTAGDPIRFSEWRSAVRTAAKSAIATLVAGGFTGYGDVYWIKESGDGLIRWTLYVEVQQDTGSSTAAAVDYMVRLLDSESGLPANTPGLAAGNPALDKILGSAIPDDSTANDYYAWRTSVSVQTAVNGSSLRVVSDTGDVNDIPSAGWVRIQHGGDPVLLRYSSVDTSGGEADIVLAAADQLPQVLLGQPAESDSDWFTVEFLGRVTGSYIDAMLQTITSSGRGDNGSYDLLDEEYGYDIEAVADGTFGGAMSTWLLLDLDVNIEPEDSFVDIFGPTCELGRVALVSRMEPDGSDVTIHAVRTDLAATPATAATLTTDDLVTVSGKNPIRNVPRHKAPNRWEIKFRVGEDEQLLIVHDVQSQKAFGLTARDVSINGVRKQDAASLFTGWASAFFSDVRRSRAVDVDIVPWKHVQAGDMVDVSFTHPDLWDPVNGPGSYVGQAFVIGSRLPPATGVQTVRLVLKDAFAGNSLSPSMKVTAFDSATAPTYIRVSGDYYDLCTAYFASSDPFTLIAYKPGADVADTQYHAIDGVSGSAATYTELSVSSTTGGHTLVVDDWYLTMPVTATANDAQNIHAHVDDGSVYL